MWLKSKQGSQHKNISSWVSVVAALCEILLCIAKDVPPQLCKIYIKSSHILFVCLFTFFITTLSWSLKLEQSTCPSQFKVGFLLVERLRDFFVIIYVIICVCHYLRMSLFAYVIISVCHYFRMSLFPYVIISICNYFHMTKTTRTKTTFVFQ